MRLLNDLMEKRFISPTNARILENYCRVRHVKPYEALLATHVLSEHSLADAIAETYDMERLFSIDRNEVDLNVLKRVSYKEAVRHRCFASHKDGSGLVSVFLLDPTDEELKTFLDGKFPIHRSYVVDQRLLLRSIEEIYPIEMQIPSLAHIEAKER